jgi:D-alanyl-D-alanine carboxypeptidase
MLSALTSLLLIGIIPPAPTTAASVRPLPGMEVLTVAPPANLKKTLRLEKLSASGMMLIDASSGEEIYSVNPDQHRPIASLTKIMTALLIMENHSLSEVVTVPAIAEQIRGSTIGVTPGQHLTVNALLKALLIPSANDAAYTLAAFHGRSIASFVQQMNARAAALGMKNTHFANPAGLDNHDQYSTPRDMAWLTMAALRHPEFRTIVSTRSAAIVSDDGKEFHLRNTNELLHENQDVFGVKTGTTDEARECLIVLFRSEGKPYLLVLLGSHDRYTDSLYVLQALGAAVQ